MAKKVLVLLLVGLLLSACQPKAPATGGDGHEPVSLELLSSPEGTIGYIMSQALADIVNKNHPWLRIKVTPMPTTLAAIREGSELPEERKRFTIALGSDQDFWLATSWKFPYFQHRKGPVEDLVFVANMLYQVTWVVTLDKDIKRGEDLIDKRVAVGPEGSTPAHLAEFVLRDIWGVYDKVEVRHMTEAEGAAALLAGEVEAYFASGTLIPPRIVPNPGVERLMESGKVYFLSFSEEDFAEGVKRNNRGYGTVYPWHYFSIPPGAFGAFFPRDYVGGILWVYSWYAWKATDRTAMFELAKTITEHVADFKDYHPAGAQLSRKTLTQAAFIQEGHVHSGALIYYMQTGLPITGAVPAVLRVKVL